MSWKRFGVGALAIVLLFACANIATYWTSGFFERERTYREEVNAVAHHPDVHVIFAGDSHTAVPLNDLIDVDPRGPAYSIAFGGDSLRECYAKLRRVLQESHTIDTLVVEADPHMFASGRLESSNRSFVDWYFLAAHDRSGLKRDWASAILDQIPLLDNDFLQYLRKQIEVGVERLRGIKVASAEDSSVAWYQLSEAQRSAAARETGIGDHAGLGSSPKPFYWFERILDLARAHHVQVIAVRYPVHPQYAAQAPAAEVARIDRFLLQHGVTRIIDLRQALSDPRDFENEDHVNDTGVVPLVAMLEKQLGRPLMAAHTRATAAVAAAPPPR